MADRDKRWGYSPEGRFQTPDTKMPFKSRYDMNSEELQNIQTQQMDALYSKAFDLSVAQPPTNPLEVVVSGRAFECKGITTSTLYDFTANTGINTVATDALIGVWVNKIGGESNALLCKNGDGFRGDFIKLYLFWPAQSGKTMSLNVFKFDDNPWISGDYST